MAEPRAQRTLVKSPPELWAEISDDQALARHLGDFGEIRITRLEAETAVAWEGDTVSGTVELEPSGWGTKVTITATSLAAAPPPTVAIPAAPAPRPQLLAAPFREPEIPAAPQAHSAFEPQPEPEPQVTGTDIPPRHEQHQGFFARLFGRLRAAGPAGVPAIQTTEPPARPAPEPEPVALAAPQPAPPPEIEPVVLAAPEPAPQVAPQIEPAALDDDRIVGILVSVLDDLGSAHHRPFSRS